MTISLTLDESIWKPLIASVNEAAAAAATNANKLAEARAKFEKGATFKTPSGPIPFTPETYIQQKLIAPVEAQFLTKQKAAHLAKLSALSLEELASLTAKL